MKEIFFVCFFLIFSFFFCNKMAEEYFLTDDIMIQSYTEQSAVLIVIKTSQQPVELQDGLLKLIAYAPHGNLVSENAMDDDSNEFKWHVK